MILRKNNGLLMIIYQKYVAWACEINRNQGEGKLAQNFLNYLSEIKGISINIKTLNNKIKISNGKLIYSYKELFTIKIN